MRHLEVSIPFTWTAEGSGLTSACRAVASVRLCKADTRAINPRKVLVRCEAVADVTVYCPRAEEVSSGVAGSAEVPVEELTETRTVYWTACVQEKPFPFTDEVALSTGKPAAVELLKCRATLGRGECKLIGNKLIFKGSVNVCLLYRGEDNGCYTASAELPFSQIMEVSGVAEDADLELTVVLTGFDCRLTGEDDGRTVTVDAQLLAQAVIREERTAAVLTDAYSTACPLDVDRAQLPVEVKTDQGSRSQSVREVWETAAPVREVLDASMDLGRLEGQREGERMVYTAQGTARVLFADESGEPFEGLWPVTVPCAIEMPEGCRCLCRCEPVGDVFAAPAAGGVEVRFTLDFRFLATRGEEISQVCALREGESPQETGEKPSLVLRRQEAGEGLWDVAKAYGTTIADIISANELEDGIPGTGKLLLIPRRR